MSFLCKHARRLPVYNEVSLGMIQLDAPAYVAADQFAATVYGWYAGTIPAESITVHIGRSRCDCSIEPRPDVEAAYPGLAVSGFRTFLDFLNLPEEPAVRGSTLELQVSVKAIA